MRILVYGAGVLGSLYAAWLKRAGHDVTILARGQRLQDIRLHGIVLRSEATGEESTTAVPVIEALGPDDAYDWVLVLTRKDQVAGILPSLAASRATPAVLFMVNNAAGPDEYIRALGRTRVALGFPGAGGMREGHAVRYTVVSGQPTTLGELDGRLTPRLQELMAALRSAGFPVAHCPNMDAWLKTHVALVSPVANAFYMFGGDNYKLAKSPEGLDLLVQAVREGFRVLTALGVPITPAKGRVLQWVPAPLLVAMVRRTLATKKAEVAMARHARVAKDEMRLLADEFRALARQSRVPTPAIDRLYGYIDGE